MVESNKKRNIEDYEFIKQIGEGAFGNVYLAKEKETSRLLAIKALDKQHILKFNKTKSVYREKDILNQFSFHPNIIKLDTTFQDKQNLYFVFENCQNGTLSNLIKKNGTFEEYITQIYAAEIISVLETIHYNNVMHRDLKPENILITQDYHVKVIDFGDANYIIQPKDDAEEQPSTEEAPTKETRSSDNFEDFENQDPSSDRRGTFVGTVFYVSPEMLKSNSANAASDIWALGCIIYRMLTGDVPFNGASDYQTFQLILERKLEFPTSIQMSDEAKDLIDKLLQLEPSQRLGAGEKDSDNDYKAIKAHPFFKGINFDTLNQIKVPVNRKVSESDDLKDAQAQWTTLSSTECSIAHQGELKKKNKFFWNQQRTFVLFKEGRISYYKDKALFRGQVKLTPDTKVVKTSKDKFEIQTPMRTYQLSEADNCRLSSDTWIEKIREVISALK